MRDRWALHNSYKCLVLVIKPCCSRRVLIRCNIYRVWVRTCRTIWKFIFNIVASNRFRLIANWITGICSSLAHAGYYAAMDWVPPTTLSLVGLFARGQAWLGPIFNTIFCLLPCAMMGKLPLMGTVIRYMWAPISPKVAGMCTLLVPKPVMRLRFCLTT